MLSILIPTYNYNVVPLVLELRKQCLKCEIEFEIICQDDASNSELNLKNEIINSLPNCSFFTTKFNLGRSKNINLLAKKASHSFVLIMEADAFPENERYIYNYIKYITSSTTVLFGGVSYLKTKPQKDKILRWKYGINRESKSLNHRLKNEYDFVFTWNLLLKKEILLQNPFPEFIKEYGYEDLIFIKNLQLNSVSITHFDNPLVHYNNEHNLDFIKKTEIAVQTLHKLIDTQKIDSKDTRLSAAYFILKKMHSIGLVNAVFTKIKLRLLKNLTSKNPNLFLLDFYKLGYYCSVQSK